MSDEQVALTALTPADAPADGEQTAAESGGAMRSTLALTSLGVVFGDLGTSPLYGFRACFGTGGFEATPANVLGIVSLIVWALVIVVCVKYVGFIMRADRDGEGGILALVSLTMARQRAGPVHRAGRRRRATALVLIGVFGAALLYGDGVITPAISVLSAVEGLGVLAPSLDRAVVPISFAILLALFLVQRFGTARVGRAFGPVMLLWFIVIAALGVAPIARRPDILGAIDPRAAVHFFAQHGWGGAIVLGGIVLVVTGTEALYADLGHFGAAPIRLAWFAVVLPALLVNYLGQGALLLADPSAEGYPFYHLVPRALHVPLVLLATVAAVISSQALVSGAFSLTRQLVQLDFAPRLTIAHTSSVVRGQVYLPFVNAALAVACLSVVAAFRSSQALGAAFGVALSGTMLATSALFCYVARTRWRWPLAAVGALGALFVGTDALFLVVNLLKFRDGGWLSVAIAVVVFGVAVTWRRGHERVLRVRRSRSMPLDRFIALVRERRPFRPHGIAVFLGSHPDRASPAMLEHVRHVGAIHEQTIVLTFVQSAHPRVNERDWLRVRDYSDGFIGVAARYGYMEMPSAPAVLQALAARGVIADGRQATFYVERDTIAPNGPERMLPLQKELYAFMSRNARSPREYFELPASQIIEFGGEVAL